MKIGREASRRAGSSLTAVRHGRRSNIAGAAVRAACTEIAAGSALRAESGLTALWHGSRSDLGKQTLDLPGRGKLTVLQVS